MQIHVVGGKKGGFFWAVGPIISLVVSRKVEHLLIVEFSYVDFPFVDGGKCGSLVAENRSLYRSGR